jgi:hypothetical protein
MLKKTLIAAAVATLTAAPAFADIDLYYGGLPISSSNDMTTTTLAAVTKDAVLSYSTAEEEIAAKFGVDGDLKQNGFITLQLSGGATWNESEVNQWLSTTGTSKADTTNIKIGLELATTRSIGSAVLSTGGTTVPVTDLTELFKYSETTGTGTNITYTLVHDIDENGTRLRLALKQTPGTANEMVSFDAAGTVLTDAEINSLAVSGGNVPDTFASLPATINGGTLDVISAAGYDALTTDAARVAYLRTENNATTAPIITSYLEGLAGTYAGVTTTAGSTTAVNLIGAGSVVNFELPDANQIFNLSDTNGTVALSIGALKNASYSADPVKTDALFKLGDLFDLTLTNSGRATALVSDGFLSYDTDSNSVANDVNVEATGFDLLNKTSNQNIQLNKVHLTMTGDMTPFRVDSDGSLLLDDGSKSGWTVKSDKTGATASLGDDVLEGVKTLDASARAVSTAQAALWTSLGKIYVDSSTNTTPIPSQAISATASVLGADQATFEDFSDTISNLFIFTRDGMKFDTILTGTTSANTIHIRDISGVLPEVGGKIYVTVWEYDAHAAGGNAESTVLADRQVLSVTLPSKGAVTLSPATIAEQLGITVTPARQARMVFEVETNEGEVAVKKKDSSGIDIQNGTKGVSTKEGFTEVDFTL